MISLLENIDYVSIPFWIGLIILVVTLLHASLALIFTLRRHRRNRLAQELEIESLKETIKTKAAQRQSQAHRLENLWSGFRKFRIDRKEPEGGNICSFYLVPHDGKPMPDFNPGQYLTFRLKISGQNNSIVRCYSLSDSPQKSDQYYRVSIKKIGPPRDQPDAPAGLSSSFFHDQLEVGDIVDAKVPSGNFYMDMTESKPVVLIGVGWE